MSLIALLVANGYLKLGAETAVGRGSVAALGRLQSTAIASIALWFAVLLAGAMLSAYT